MYLKDIESSWLPHLIKGVKTLKRLSLICIYLILFFFASPAFSFNSLEPIKRLTATEIYHVLLFFPVGGNISEVYKNAGKPDFEDASYAVYHHNRTKDVLLLKKTSFDMIEVAFIIEESKSLDDMEARKMLITEQFLRRFGYPFRQDETGSYWNIENLVVSITTSPHGEQFSPAVIYQSWPKTPGL